ncbi:4'-phosphopantetheinyl transferase [Mesorhizobium sp. NPDC059054]|uniref:4'-phosphopantetheinyl transferase family protein n=1 Tax=Mesorhizobium sp. NPDC059054 TaxID=3346711 RepID=UPI0036737273
MIIAGASNSLPFRLEGVVCRRCDYSYLPSEQLASVRHFDQGWDAAKQGVFDLSAPGSRGSAWLDLPPTLALAVTRRRADYFAGRICASLAIKELTGRSHDIPIMADRSPAWPKGTLGSISHTADHAVAIAASTGLYRLLGVDVEKLISQEQLQAVRELACCDGDIEFQPVEMPYDAFLTLIFSAKEAVYKAAYPLVRQVLDFKEVIVLDITATTIRLAFRRTSPFAGIIPISIPVLYRFCGPLCFCVAYDTCL